MSKSPLSKRNSNDPKPSQAGREKYLPVLLAIVIVAALVVGITLLIKLFPKEAGPPRKMVQQVTIMTPPPPPPPPPPQEEIKEPEIKEEPIKDETEAPPNDEPQEEAPNNEASADAQSGNDVFGQQKNTGRGWGTGAGGGGYEQHVRAEINEFITESDRLKRLDYIAEVTLRIAENGEFEQFDVEIVSGDQEAGDLIRTVLKNKRKLAKPRPLEAPSVVKLRVKSVL